ncbi:DExH-box ATP-dependent RNA helicase DExH5, mitochondrial-like isoform X3 [Rhododendron vialii]|uniref:DExH-box ATP-dependent RNA helicase DExH5, mitochondrial-like isoform X3 n=1 Tax=Rhododendron vialii TaxID=182163 RepID=UPI00265F223D|nr:DExH-box ATP-dependent RNA helicase DExH5, mitochondrial-like isoform X3 [Rhododendron vialii]
MIFRPMASILRLLLVPSTDESALYGETRQQKTSEMYMKQLEVVRLLRALFRMKAQQCSFDFKKDINANPRELLFLLLSSYGATLSEVDLEIYSLMLEIESANLSNSGSIAEMDYLWGSAAIRIRKEREQEQDLSSHMMKDVEAVEGRRTQFRENLPIDPKLCAYTVLHFPIGRNVSEVQHGDSDDMNEVVKNSVKVHKLARHLVEHCSIISWLSSIVSVFCGKQYQAQTNLPFPLSNRALEGASTCDYIEGWKWKMTTLLRSKEKQELVSRDKKDRLDFEQIAALASKMGLYSHLYVKVVVVSKVPLPNYRFDLDERRPQREVSLPLGLQKRVDSYLGDYLSQKSRNMDSFQDNGFSRSNSSCSVATDEGLFEQPEPLPQSKAAMEKVIWRRSTQMRSQQQAWQESPEGRKMLEFRRSLPAYKEKNALLMAISNNQVVIISGETGCGKTTQIPQFILESEIESVRGVLCSIICTQPRRISAMSVSERVAAERGEKLGETVGYKVRLEGMKGRDTHLLFCTTGILLRRLLADRNLKGVTYVIVDEIHERGMNEDFLLIVLKDLLPRRPELRLILMSATLDAELFSSYFGGAPMVHIPGFTYPVHTHFLENVLEMTGYQLTPYNQIDDYGQEKTWKMNKQAPRKRKSQLASAVEDALRAADFKNFGPETQESLSCWNPDSIGFNLIEYLLCNICEKETPGAVLVFMTGWDDISSLKDKLQAHPMLGDTSRVLLLACHGSMASAEQKLIFDEPEDGVRKIVLATNIAETSITINDVVFVIDCGKAKESSYDALNNTPCLLPSWISKVSAQQLAEAAKAQFSRDYSDHLALVRAYEGWKEAERDLAGYEYCWKNFLSAQSMKAIDALRREFYSLLRDAGLVDSTTTTCDSWSYDVHLLRAVICYGLYPGICSVVHNEKSFSLKTMEDGQVLLYSNSVNARDSKIPYPWLVFNEKIKVNSVFLRDSTAVSDSVLLLFGGSILRGDTDGHLKMLGGYLEFFMKPATAEMYQSLRKELEELIQNKLLNPRMVLSHHELLSAVRLLISEDQCDGRFVFNRQVLQQPSVTTIATRPAVVSRIESGPGGDNSKSQLQTLLTRAGYAAPTYKTKQLNNNQFRATVEFKGMQIMGRPCNNKKQAEKDAAAEALECLMGGTHRGHDYVENMSMMLKKSKKDHNG